MIDLLLVTGFLGAGKTTFLKRLLRLNSGRRMEVIVNEFGKAGVDGVLLAGLNAAVRQIDNGSIFCSCRVEQFEEALRDAVRREPDLILVEASGLSDPTTIREIIGLVPGIAYNGCVAVADATNIRKVIETARVCSRQLGVSSLILLNKMDMVSPEEASADMRMLRDRYPLAALYGTTQALFLEEWLEALTPVPENAESIAHTRDIALQKAGIGISREMTSAQLKAFIRLFAEDTNRVKGILTLKDGTFLADCVGASVKVTPFSDGEPDSGNRLNALAGPGLPMRKSIRDAVSLYSEYITEVE